MRAKSSHASECLKFFIRLAQISGASRNVVRVLQKPRTAEFFLHTNKRDPRILETGRLGSRSFEEAVAVTDLEIKKVSIPFEETFLPGYLCQVDREVRPLLIVQPGFDGTMEELYFGFAKAALERGVHCLVFEGPGQGSVIREQRIAFRPDWEHVIGPVVDFAVQQPMVDKSQLILCGISLGGLLAARALAFEKRIKIGIVNGAMWDFHELATQENKQLQACLECTRAAHEVDTIVYKMMESSATLRWAVGHGMYAFGADSPSDWMKKTRAYTLQDVIANISCQMVVVESDQDTLTGTQSQKLYKELLCPKERMVFTAAEGAGDHCQVGAPRRSVERVFNWLEKALMVH